MRIEFWWIGQGASDEQGMEQARAHLESEFGARVVPGSRPGRPEDAFDARRRQYSSSRILKWLAAERPSGSDKVLGVCNEDLFIPILTYVFGEAQLGGQAAVVSVARLQPVPGMLPTSPKLVRTRLMKECAHELGHAFGLLHCESPRCVMRRSASVADVDAKGATLCQDCRARVREHRRRGGGDE